jgi:hypothetical protein
MRDARRFDATTDRSPAGEILTLTEVFGTSKGQRQPRFYLERTTVDAHFRRALVGGTHIAVFGTPGVGKSTLLQRHTGGLPHIFVGCRKGQNLPDLYRSMLSEAGARLKTERRLNKKRRLGVTLKLFSGESERGTETTETEVTIDLGNVGDVFRTLALYVDNPLIILNDFHVLPRRTQRQLMRNLQYIFERTTAQIVVVGNWYTFAYLTDLNELLPSFLADVRVTSWSDQELRQMLRMVESLLNVEFSTAVEDTIVNVSAGSARELIEVCKALLIEFDVEHTQDTTREIADTDRLRKIMRTRTDLLFRRYRELLMSYLTIKPWTTEGVQLEDFLLRHVGGLLAPEAGEIDEDEIDEEEDEDEDAGEIDEVEKDKYSFEELKQALELVVLNRNQPLEDKQKRRCALVEQLAAATKRDGMEASVPLESMLGDGMMDVTSDEAAYRKACKALVSAQKRKGFYPPLVAYDPRARALVALEPRFRAFLRTDVDDIRTLQQSIAVSVVDVPSWRTQWPSLITNAARANRWRAAHPGSQQSGKERAASEE